MVTMKDLLGDLDRYRYTTSSWPMKLRSLHRLREKDESWRPRIQIVYGFARRGPSLLTRTACGKKFRAGVVYREEPAPSEVACFGGIYRGKCWKCFGNDGQEVRRVELARQGVEA